MNILSQNECYIDSERRDIIERYKKTYLLKNKDGSEQEVALVYHSTIYTDWIGKRLEYPYAAVEVLEVAIEKPWRFKEVQTRFLRPKN